MASPTESCTRCGRPITKNQTCFFKGARWPCIPASDNTVIQVDGLLIKTGDGYGKPVEILDDPYEREAGAPPTPANKRAGGFNGLGLVH